MIFFNGNLIQKRIPLNEAYFGKTPELVAIEKQLGKFRSKYIGHNYTPKASSDPDKIKFEEMIEDYFGFDILDLTVENKPVVNAYTMPISMRYDIRKPSKMVEATSKGFKYKNEAKYAAVISIYTGCIFNAEFTDEEILAILLHEIGHNFQSAINDNSSVLTTYNKILIVPSLLIMVLTGKMMPLDLVEYILSTSNTFMRLDGRFTRYLNKKTPVFMEVVGVLNALGDIFDGIGDMAFKIVDILSLGLLSLACSAISAGLSVFDAVRNPLGIIVIGPIKRKRYMDEQIADNFASMYGYGPALASAIPKLLSYKSDPFTVSKALSSIPVTGTIYRMNNNIARIVAGMFDEHPYEYFRLKGQLDMLREELNKSDLKPAMKKRIKEDADRIEKEIDEFLDKSEGIKDKDFANKAWNVLLAENMNQKNFNILASIANARDKSMGDNTRFNQYDKIFDKVKLK